MKHKRNQDTKKILRNQFFNHSLNSFRSKCLNLWAIIYKREQSPRRELDICGNLSKESQTIFRQVLDKIKENYKRFGKQE